MLSADGLCGDVSTSEDIRFDINGKPYFFDPANAPSTDEAHADHATEPASGGLVDAPQNEEKFPLDAIPALHSYPGAPNILYLDFDGEIVDKTDWNLNYHNRPIHAAPYDMDGDATTFTQSELDVIEEVWQRVSEDFLPFDIDITTEEPPQSLLGKSRGAMRAVISTNLDDATMGGTGEAWHVDVGGVAYTNSWFTPNTPVWVFHNLVPPTAKGIAEAASHEFGHAFGLVHHGEGENEYYHGHGEGETSWAPIMGTGYHSNVTQWSKGEYSGATTSQSDVSLITEPVNGIKFREDDIGQGSAFAEPLEVNAGWVSGAGMIAEEWDYDTFVFQHPGGPVNLNVRPAAIGPNLDVLVTLFDSDEDEIGRFESTESIDVWLHTELVAGTYYIDVEGDRHYPDDGQGYSDYGSVGAYEISGFLGTPPVTANAGGEIGWQEGGLYRFDEGKDVVLNASDSYGPDNELQFAWDIDGDGLFDDAVGESPTLTWDQLALTSPGFDSGMYEVSVRVTATDGTSDIQTAALQVNNLAPTIESVGAMDVTSNTRTRFQVVATDLGGDPLTYEWNAFSIDSAGDSEVEVEAIDSGEAPFVHFTFDELGTYEVRVRVQDDDGGASSLVIPVNVREGQDTPAVVASSVIDEGILASLSSLTVEFNRDVSASLDVSNLTIANLHGGLPLDVIVNGVSWDANTFSATYTFADLADGNYLLSLRDIGVGGLALDGNGDGSPGGAWQVNVTIDSHKASDLNRDSVVDFADFLILSANFGDDSATSADGDVNGDGRVNFLDFLVFSANFGVL